MREGVLFSPPVRDFDDNDFPLAYLITFRCYGTWLHGDDCGSMDRRNNIYETLKIPTNLALELSDKAQRKHSDDALDGQQRLVVEAAIRRVCEYRRYLLRAINVRTNHVHTVVSAMLKPEPILNAFKTA